MTEPRPIHPDFEHLLDLKEQQVVELFTDLRRYILELYPQSNELLYHTHALTAVFSISEKLSDAFCHIPVYTNHINLGFNKGAVLNDSNKLLSGTGKLIRHIRISKSNDYRNHEVESLIKEAFDLALDDRNQPNKNVGKTISKI
jgi:hypothetical protein